MLIDFLQKVRDARLVWDVMGSVYNRRIYGAISELYAHIAGELQNDDPARILDVGAGRGYVSLLLAAGHPGAQITGIDFSPLQVRAAEGLRRERDIPNCRFVRGNAMAIDFSPGLFDVIVSVGSIKHWPDAGQGLREIYRVLKPGGRLLLSETDQGASDAALHEFVRRFSIWFIPDGLFFWGLRHVVFGRSFTQEGLEALVRDAGFQHIEGQRVSGCPYTIVKARKML